MSSKGIESEGIVIEALRGATFRVKLENSDATIIAHLSGKMKTNFIRVVNGDRVIVEISPYDLTKGRILLRL